MSKFNDDHPELFRLVVLYAGCILAAVGYLTIVILLYQSSIGRL